MSPIESEALEDYRINFSGNGANVNVTMRDERSVIIEVCGRHQILGSSNIRRMAIYFNHVVNKMDTLARERERVIQEALDSDGG
jgi:hypothetical protein